MSYKGRSFFSPRFSALTLACLCLFSAGTALASATDGTIDSVNRYAWSENTGWIDFGASTDPVHVTDTALMGAAYGETIGWIILDPSQGGVSNNAEGTLSGYAWSENTGWIDFSNVVIDSNGVFTGAGYGETIGWIPFDAAGATVSTDWRPLSVRITAPALESTSSRSRGGNVQNRYNNLVRNGNEAAAAELSLQCPQFFSTASASASTLARDLTLGATGPDVQALQVFLNTQGFRVSASGPGAPGEETTYFGSATVRTLAAFQAANGISPALGFFGPLTRAAIVNVSGTPVTPPSTITPTTSPSSSAWPRDLDLAASGPDVSALQQLLIEQNAGAASIALKSACATGYFGALTQAALVEFQVAHSILPSVGYFGPVTRAFVISLAP